MTIDHDKRRERKRLERKRWKSGAHGRMSSALQHRRAGYAIKIEAMTVYAGGDLRCHCECGCREANHIYLDLDHVNDDGAAHRRSLFGKPNHCGTKFYSTLKRLGWPKDPPLQVLCCKCHIGKHRNGGQCPELGTIALEDRPIKRRNCGRKAKQTLTPLFDMIDED